MSRIEFLPSGKAAECQPGESVFVVAQRAGVKVETACVGKGTCGLCRVVVKSGGEHLSEPGEIDEKHLGNVYWLTQTRLACQAICDGGGDVVVEVVLKSTEATSPLDL